jgi:hypothetical protein
VLTNWLVAAAMVPWTLGAMLVGIIMGRRHAEAQQQSVDDYFDDTARTLGHPDQIDTDLPAFKWPADAPPGQDKFIAEARRDIAKLSEGARKREAARRIDNEHR